MRLTTEQIEKILDGAPDGATAASKGIEPIYFKQSKIKAGDL